MKGLVARAGGGDLVNVLHAERGFDDHLKADALFIALGVLDLGDQHVQRIDVGGRPRLGDHDQVQLVDRLFQHVDHVPVHVVGVQAVDADGHGVAAPVQVVQGLDDVLAGLFLVGRRHGVLQVEENHVRLAAGGLLQELGIRSRDRQFRPVEARETGLDDGETHGLSPLPAREIGAGLL